MPAPAQQKHNVGIPSCTWPTLTPRSLPRGRARPCRPRRSGSFAGGLDGAEFVWGDEWAPRGRMTANTWQRDFLWQNLVTDTYEGTPRVDAFPPNGYGLYDMIGNVWEWTTDWYTRRHPDEAAKACCYCRRYRPAARYPQPVDISMSHVGFRSIVRVPI